MVAGTANGVGTAEAVDAWIPKVEAAAFLGCSVRQLERWASRGCLEVRTVRRERGRGQMAIYSRADLEAVKAGTPRQHGVPVPAKPAAPAAAQYGEPVTARTALELIRSPAGGDAVEMIGAYLARLASAATAAPEPARPWLALDEAAEYSGLPAAFLLRQARAGVAWAVNVGSDKAARWRFRRDALAGSL